MSREELRVLLGLLRRRGASRPAVRRVAVETLRAGGTVRDAAFALNEAVGVDAIAMAHVDSDVDAVDRLGLTVVCVNDAQYPKALASIPDPPIALFIGGCTSALTTPLGVAIVGSRRSSAEGRALSRSIAADLGRAGLSVISGMAVGIDGAAHRGALDVGAPTIAVMGAGHSHIYPRSHGNLVREIVAAAGAVVTEYAPSEAPLRGNFPERNRVISGLSAGVLVVEANVKSGSLITARMALEQGREVMTVPGSVLEGRHGGCHRLIKQGAALVEDATDVLHVFGLENVGVSVLDAPRDPVLRRVLDALPPAGAVLHDIVESLAMPVEDVLRACVELELEGFVDAVPGGYIRRPRSTTDNR